MNHDPPHLGPLRESEARLYGPQMPMSSHLTGARAPLATACGSSVYGPLRTSLHFSHLTYCCYAERGERTAKKPEQPCLYPAFCGVLARCQIWFPALEALFRRVIQTPTGCRTVQPGTL